MTWVYRTAYGIMTDDVIPEGAVGFVYKMTAVINGEPKSYIGKKNFYSIRKKKFGKKALEQMKDKRVIKYTIEKKTNYQNYYSSNEVLKKAKADGVEITREILKVCYSNIELTYQEAKYMFLLNVLEDEHYLNNNILGKFYKGKIKKDE
jgi:hypothetical protein